MKHWLISIALIFCCISFYAQKNADEIIWSKDYKLTWDDFQGRPKSSMKVGAVTSSGIGRYLTYRNGVITISTKTYFFKKDSWVKENAKNSSVLEHEQLHFDITELYARKFRKSLIEAKFKKNGEKAKKKFLAIYDLIAKEWDAYQDLYDQETSLSTNETKQKEWVVKIAKELEGLEEYSNPEINIDLNKKKSCKK